MKILCFTDNHFCERSSIINKFGTNYSIRLENQIQSYPAIQNQSPHTHTYRRL